MKPIHYLTAAAAALALTGGGTGAVAKTAHGAKAHAARGAGGRTVTTRSGLKYQDIKVGTGPSPRVGQTVVVDYVGTLTNGTKFDASRDHGQPFSFPLGVHRVIPGWDEGVATMRVGGERKLIVPPNLGYGASGAGGVIPPNATLLFDIKLLGLR